MFDGVYFWCITKQPKLHGLGYLKIFIKTDKDDTIEQANT